MVVSILGFLALPYLHTSQVRSGTFRPLYRTIYWFFVVDVFLLGWIGQKYVEYPYVEIGQLGTRYYFGFMFVLVPLVGAVENALANHKA
jgi:ubiquinol-cytochrome c reductase cytochrome b subunit